MQVIDIIEKKRNGEEHSPEELNYFVQEILKGKIPDYQISAWLMAVYLKGLKPKELAEWTRLMWRSGSTLQRKNREDVWVDKHSVGGVGDKTSIILVPLVIATATQLFGEKKVKIPMVSGRGLGHSGGTLDKLESVPGFNTHLSLFRAVELLEKNSFFMLGQTEEIAPLDRLLYSLRDVTATVDSIPLIISSIMSKKLSENLDALVIDLKVGDGAFMKEKKRAKLLGKGLLEVAKVNGVQASYVMTRMDEPLGYKVGNRLEIEECADFLTGKERELGLLEVVLSLATQMLYLAGKKKVTQKNCLKACKDTLNTQVPFEIFKKMFQFQGGDWDKFIKEPDKNLFQWSFKSECKGTVRGVSARAIGLLLNELGGGRHKKEDMIDPHVGFYFKKKVGDQVIKGEEIVTVYYRKAEQRKLLEEELKKIIIVKKGKVAKKKWVLETV